MSRADAFPVRLSELRSDSRVFVPESEFRRYRRHGHQVVPLVAPL